MAGFFRKVASSFVALPEAQAVSPTFDDSELDDVADPDTDATEAAFVAAGLVDGPNSADRLLKMIAGLAMFPPDQQLAMVRALDAADDSWSEQAVLTDAQARLTVLRTHHEAVERDHAGRLQSFADREHEVRTSGDAAVAEIDRQIATLRERRQETLVRTGTTLAALDGERRALEGTLNRFRSSSLELAARLSGLVTFFGGPHRPIG